MDDPSLLLMLSNLLHLHAYLDPSSYLLSDYSPPPSAAIPTASTTTSSFLSSSASPLFFFAIASILSYAVSSSSSSLCPGSRPGTNSPPPPPPPPRSIPSSSSFFLTSDRILSMDPATRDARFRSLYGVSHPIFDTLLKNLRLLTATNGGGRLVSSLPLEQSLAVGLARLSRGVSSRALARSLSLQPLLVSRATHALTRLLATRLYSRYVVIPLADHLLSAVQSFLELTSLPNIAGAIASSAVRLKRLRSNDDDAEQLLRSPQRPFPSILLQAVADHRKVFWDACVRATGSSDSASHLRDSRLYHRLLADDNDKDKDKDVLLLRDSVVSVRGHHVRPYLIGDSSYPILPFLLTPFSSSSSSSASPVQEAFDAALVKGRAASVEAAIALLKGRWKILRNLNVGLDHAAQTVVACVVLHNMCQFAKEPEDEGRYMWRDPPESLQHVRPLESERPLYHWAESVRQALAEDLYERQVKLAGTR